MEKRKLRLYRILKLSLQRVEYLDNVADADDRRLMTAMRSGTNTLRIDTGRWVNEEAEERKCILSTCTPLALQLAILALRIALALESAADMILACWERSLALLKTSMLATASQGRVNIKSDTDTLSQRTLAAKNSAQ